MNYSIAKTGRRFSRDRSKNQTIESHTFLDLFECAPCHRKQMQATNAMDEMQQ